MIISFKTSIKYRYCVNFMVILQIGRIIFVPRNSFEFMT